MKLTRTETQTPCTHRVACTRVHVHSHWRAHTHTHTCSQVSVHVPTHTYMHSHQPPNTHIGGSRALVLAYTKCPPPPTPPHWLTLKGNKIKITITTMASQVQELLCQSMDWINCKILWSLWASKMIQPGQTSVRSKSVSACSPLHLLWRSCRTL